MDKTKLLELNNKEWNKLKDNFIELSNKLKIILNSNLPEDEKKTKLLEIAWIKVNEDDLKQISKYPIQEIEKFIKVRKAWIDVTFYDLKDFPEYSEEDIKILIREFRKNSNISFFRYPSDWNISSIHIKWSKIKKFLPEWSFIRKRIHKNTNLWEIHIGSKEDYSEPSEDLLINMKNFFRELQIFLSENKNDPNFPKYIIWISYLSKFAGRYGFEIIDLQKWSETKTNSWNKVLDPEIYSPEIESMFFDENWKQKKLFSLKVNLWNWMAEKRNYEEYKNYESMSKKFKAEDIKICFISTQDFLKLKFNNV